MSEPVSTCPACLNKPNGVIRDVVFTMQICNLLVYSVTWEDINLALFSCKALITGH